MYQPQFCPYQLIEGDVMVYKQFHCPTTISVSGSTNSGKTHFVKRLLELKTEMFSPPARKIIYFYGVWQSLFDDMERNLDIVFHKGIPTSDSSTSLADGDHHIIVMDDLMDDVTNSKDTQNLFTRGSHHRNLTIIYLNQNMYCQGKSARTINLNTHYMVLMRNPRDVSQVSVLAKQTGLGKTLVEAYKECTDIPYGYLLVNLHPQNSFNFKLKSHIFPEEDTIVYI